MREQPAANLMVVDLHRSVDRREGRLRSLQRFILIVCSVAVLSAAALHLGYLALGGR